MSWMWVLGVGMEIVARILDLQEQFTAGVRRTGRLDKIDDLNDMKNKTNASIKLLQTITEALGFLNKDAATNLLAKIEAHKSSADVVSLLNEKGYFDNQYLPTPAEWADLVRKHNTNEAARATLMQELNEKLTAELNKLDMTNAKNVDLLEKVYTAKKILYPLLTDQDLLAALTEDKATLHAWNAAFTEQANTLFTSRNATESATLTRLFDQKKIIAKHLYALEAPLHRLTTDFSPLNNAIDDIKRYALMRYENINDYTNIFGLGESRATKLSGALTMCDRIVVNVKGNPLSREGVAGVTRGRLGAVINGLSSTINGFFTAFAAAVAAVKNMLEMSDAPSSLSTTSLYLPSRASSVSSSSGSASSYSAGSNDSGSNASLGEPTAALNTAPLPAPRDLEALKSGVRTNAALLQSWYEQYNKCMNPILTEDAPPPTYFEAKFSTTQANHTNLVSEIEAFKPSWLPLGQKIPDDKKRHDEKHAFSTSVTALCQVLAEAANTLFLDKHNNAEKIKTLCALFKAIKYKQPEKTLPDNAIDPLITFIQQTKDEKEYKAAIKCLACVAATGTISHQLLKDDDGKLLIDGELGKLVRKIQYPKLTDDKAKMLQEGVYKTAHSKRAAI